MYCFPQDEHKTVSKVTQRFPIHFPNPQIFERRDFSEGNHGVAHRQQQGGEPSLDGGTPGDSAKVDNFSQVSQVFLPYLKYTAMEDTDSEMLVEKMKNELLPCLRSLTRFAEGLLGITIFLQRLARRRTGVA